MNNKLFFFQLGSFLYRFRKIVLFLFLAMTIALSFIAIKLPTILGGSGFEMDGSFKKVQNTLQQNFDAPKSTMILLFDSTEYAPEDEKYQLFVQDTLKKMDKIEEIYSITSPYESNGMIKDNIAYATLNFQKSQDDLKPALKQVRQQLDHQSTKDISVQLTGGPVIIEDMNKASQQSLAKAEMIGIPVALIILLLAFGSFVAAMIPLLIGFISVVVAMGLLYLLGVLFDLNLSVFLLNVVPMIGLALGIDFALLMVSRFREELTHTSVEQATTIVVGTAGRSIAFSGICVFLGLSGMLFIQIDLFQTVAIGGMIVVIISVLTAIIFLPTVLALLGEKINKWQIIKVKDSKQSFWHSFASFVMKRPIMSFLVTMVLLIVFMLPISDIRFNIPEADALPTSYESREAFETFEKTFHEDELYPVIMVLENKQDIMTEKGLEDLQQYIQAIEKEHVVKRVDSVFSYTDQTDPRTLLSLYENETTKQLISPALEASVHKNQAIVRTYINVDTTSTAAKDFVRKWEGSHGDLLVTIGGNTKFYQEIFDEIIEKVPYGALLIFVSTFFILLLAFRSVLIPLKAILMNVVSLTATFGILVYLFQKGHLGDPTDIALMIPVFIFGLVFGLSMDYEVFLISRMQEVYVQTRDNDQATLFGLTKTSKIITSAALIMIVITGAFAFTGIMPVKQMGVGVALAIFIDATLVRMILVPSLMKLLGDYNWWAPSFLQGDLYTKQMRKNR